MKLDRLNNYFLFNLTLFLSMARFTSVTLKMQLTVNVLFTLIFSLLQSDILMMVSSPVQLFLISQYQLDKADMAILGVYTGTLLMVIYLTRLDVCLSKLMSDFFVRCFRFFSYLFFIRSLVPYELKNYNVNNSILVLVLLAGVVYSVGKYYGSSKVPRVSLFISGIVLYVAIEQLLIKSGNLGSKTGQNSIGYNSSSTATVGNSSNSLFANIAQLTPLPFIHNDLKTVNLIKFVVFPIYITFETLIAFKTLRIKHNDRRVWYFLLSLVNFVSGLFGLHCTNIPVLLNRKLNETCKTKSSKLQLMLISLALFVFCPERILLGLKYNLFVYMSLLGFLIYYTFDLNNMADLFKKGRKELVLLMLTFLVAMVTKSIFMSCFIVFITEWAIYAFKADSIRKPSITTALGGQIKKYNLAEWYDDVAVYKLEGCANFLRTAAHIKRIRNLDSRIVVVDIEPVLSKYDRDFVDSYEDLISQTRSIQSKLVVVYGSDEKVRTNAKDKYF